MNYASVVVAEEESPLREQWTEWLREAGQEVVACHCIRTTTEVQFASVLVAGCGCSQKLLCDLRVQRIPVVFIAKSSSEQMAIDALRAGCADYLRAPVQKEDLIGAVCRLCPNHAGEATDEMVGQSSAMQELRQKVKRVARVRSNVLITGETGTGKELVARAIHRQSECCSGPFVCVNCAAIPEALVESELFGYERGAFTGATASYTGKLEAARKGTIFLDEVGDMSLMAQAKILRAVETHEFYRLGGKTAIPVNVRIVAATHRNLEKMAEVGEFRSDLLYRLDVARVHLAPLRERREDIRPIARHCLTGLNRELDTTVEGLSEEVWERLMNYSWPGNVRELRNMLESFLVQAPAKTITLEDLPPDLRAKLAGCCPDRERELLINALLETQWNKSRAAKKLHWSRMTIYRKMAKYSLHYSPR